MSALAIVLIVIGALVLLLLLGGLAASRRRARRLGSQRDRAIAAADRQLEEARAADRGWDRALLTAAADAAVAEARPDFSYERLDLVLVDDRPGVSEDRAHLVASGSQGQVRVVLARRDGEWIAERVE
jgi:type II secretory pathway pseudopilin PulG